MKRGWNYNSASGYLSSFVDGIEAIRLTKSTDGVDFKLFGDTPATYYINFDASGPTLTMASVSLSMTGTGVVDMGTSSTPLALTAGSPIVDIYSTCASTSGSTSAEPFYLKSTMTGTGGVGGRARFHLYTNVTLGGWANALKAYAEFGTSGKVTGLASAFCAEMSLPNANMGSGGAYYPLEIEHVSGGTSLVTAGSLSGNHTGFIYMAASGDADGDFDDHGFLFTVTGLTSGSGHLFYANKSVPFDAYLKIGVGTATYYLGLLAQQAAAS
jgi:hypothetical protein